VEKSKTDCYRKGNHVIISRLDSLQCPVKILSSYLREAQIELASDMYIFRPISFLAHLTRSELLPSLGVRRPSVNIAGGHIGFSIGPKSSKTWLAACNDHS
jgi:hypothetical protein